MGKVCLVRPDFERCALRHFDCIGGERKSLISKYLKYFSLSRGARDVLDDQKIYMGRVVDGFKTYQTILFFLLLLNLLT